MTGVRERKKFEIYMQECDLSVDEEGDYIDPTVNAAAFLWSMCVRRFETYEDEIKELKEKLQNEDK